MGTAGLLLIYFGNDRLDCQIVRRYVRDSRGLNSGRKETTADLKDEHTVARWPALSLNPSMDRTNGSPRTSSTGITYHLLPGGHCRTSRTRCREGTRAKYKALTPVAEGAPKQKDAFNRRTINAQKQESYNSNSNY